MPVEKINNIPEHCKKCPLTSSKSITNDDLFKLFSQTINGANPDLPQLNILFSEEMCPEDIESFYHFVQNNSQLKSKFSVIGFVPIPQCMQTMGGDPVKHCIHNGPISEIIENSVNVIAGSKVTKVIKFLCEMYGLPVPENISTPFRIYAGVFIPDYFKKLDFNGEITGKVKRKKSNLLKMKKELKSLMEESGDEYQVSLKEADIMKEDQRPLIYMREIQNKEIELKRVVFITFPTLYRLFQEIGLNTSMNSSRKVFDLIDAGVKILKDVDTDRIYLKEVKTSYDPSKEYYLDAQWIAKHLEYLIKHPELPFAIDTETLEGDKLGLNWRLPGADFASISIAYRDANGKLIAFSFPWKLGIRGWDFHMKKRAALSKRLKKLILSRTAGKGELIGHKIKYDMKWLMHILEIPVEDIVKNKINLYDTKSTAHVINDNLTSSEDSLENLGVKYLNFPDWKGVVNAWNTMQGQKVTELQKQRMHKMLLEYSSIDAEATFLLYETFQKQAQKEPDNIKVLKYFPLFIRNTLVLEYNGIKIDKDRVKKLSDFLQKKYQHHLDQVYTILERYSEGKYNYDTFNINSTPQITSFLTNNLGVNLTETTSANNYKFDSKVRKELLKRKDLSEDAIKFIKHFTFYKSYSKALTAFLKDYKKRAEEGYVYPEIKIIGTKTGRTTANNPNIQQISNIHDLKTVFVPRGKDRYIVYSDYKQAEVRMLALLSQDVNLLQVFEQKVDPYLGLASQVYGISIDEARARHGLRDAMKQILLGMNYGMSEYGVAKGLGITEKEAKILMDDFFKTFSGVPKYQKELVDFCINNAYVPGPTYKRRRFPSLNIELDYTKKRSLVEYKFRRYVINSPIQSSTSDFALKNFCDISEYCITHNMDATLVGLIHDAVLFDVHKKDLVKMIKLMNKALPRLHPYIIEYMDNKYGKNNYIIPDFPSDIKVGKNWEEFSASNPQGLRGVMLKDNKLTYLNK